jgi:hypothetical protein
VTSSFVVVELPIALQYSLGHSSWTLELIGLCVESSFAALEGSKHSNCYSMRSWDGFATLDCRCWSMDCLGRVTILSHIVCLLLIYR